jgi:hypothetical protein
MSKHYYYKINSNAHSLSFLNGCRYSIYHYANGVSEGVVAFNRLVFFDELQRYLKNIDFIKNITKQEYEEKRREFRDVLYPLPTLKKADNTSILEYDWSANQKYYHEEDDCSHELRLIIEAIHDKTRPYQMKMLYPLTYAKYQLFIESLIKDVEELEYNNLLK